MISPSYKPAFVYGGPTRAVADLCENLACQGAFVKVYSTDANGISNLHVNTGTEYSIDGIPVIYYHRWTKDHSHLSPKLLWNVIFHMRQFDVIHLFSWWNLVTVPVMMICVLRGVRPVLSVHGTLSLYTFLHSKSLVKKLFHHFIGRFLLKHAILHVTTEKEQDEVKSVVPNARIKLIPNFIYFPPAIAKIANGENIFRLLFVGRLDAVKNIEFLIELLHQKWDMQIQLEIMGEGSAEYTAYLHNKSAMNKQITWVGNKDGDEKWQKLASVDLLVLPSHTENFGLVVIEALSQGTPVLISDQVGIKQYIINNNLGWVAKAEFHEWKRMLNSIWSNVSERERIRKEAPGKIKSDFDPSKLVQQYLQVYQQAKYFRKLA
jgi:glycosyltransferase involved in cell wall biosynthesis